MARKRKRATILMAPLPSSSSLSMVKMILCLVGSVHINHDNAPYYHSVAAFSPPRPPVAPYAHRVAYSAASSSLSSRDGLSNVPKSRLYALPRSSSDATTRQQSTQQEQEDRPFFLQDMDGRVDNDPPSNGNNGGMDAYARQMQDFADASGTDGMAAAETATAEPRIESPSPPPYPPMGRQQQQSETSSSSPEASSSAADDQAISSVDARVLESILSEGKLDLSTEEQVKKLLDGPRLQEGEEYPNGAGGDMDGKYNSKFVSAVSDNAFWNSLKAKAAEIIDSVGIYIENRIERDAQTLAAVGLFTLDRIRRDIGRALPAAGRATRNLLLSTNSSYAERFLDVTDKTPFALPAERTATDREMLGDWTDLYDELTTPADEIRQVTGAIRDILAGKELPDDYASSRRGVRSFAPAGTSRMAERQRRAYKARKKTVLKREREGVDRRVGRAFGSVSDATWELRREMQTDRGREAGYRSKGVRRALASGATKLLEAGRESSRRLLSGERRRNNMISAGEVEIVDDAVSPNIVDVSPVEEEEIIEEVIQETNMEYAPDGLLSPQSFIEEKRRLIASLESCLSRPSETWLTKEVVAQATEAGISLDGTVLRAVITSMVTLRDGLQKEMEDLSPDLAELKMEYVSLELRRMKSMVDSLCDVAVSAAGESAATLLKQELEGFVLSDSLDDIIDIELERMEQLLAEMVEEREREMQARKDRQRRKIQEQRQYQQDVANTATTATEVVPDDSSFFGRATSAARNFNSQFTDDTITEVEVVSSSNEVGASYSYGNTMNQEGPDQYSQTQPDSRVEVVSDTEYSEYEQQFKSAQAAAVDATGDYDVDAVDEENPAADFVLRVVDVVFFVGEKFFLVLLPDLVTGGARVTSRYARAQNRGRGSVGWKPLRYAKTKNIR